MKYLVLPILIVLGLAELLLRGTLVVVGTVLSMFLLALYFADNPESLEDFMSPVCFKIAERII